MTTQTIKTAPEPRITADMLKKQWKARKEFGGFAGSFRDFLREESTHADSDPKWRDRGETYADAAFLLLERK